MVKKCPSCGKTVAEEKKAWDKRDAWLKNNDLEIVYDKAPDSSPKDWEKEKWAHEKHNTDFDELSSEEKGEFFENWYEKNAVDQYYVQTMEDRSVGIWGFQLSPVFHNTHKLSEWIDEMMEMVPER